MFFTTSMATMLNWMRLPSADRMAFVAPPDPPAPAPADPPPPAPAAPDPPLVDSSSSILVQPGSGPVLPEYDSNVTFFEINNVSVVFGGAGDTMQLGKSSNDIVTATGSSQTINLLYAGQDTVIDRGHGLTISPNPIFGTMTVQDFDPAGRVIVQQQTGTLAPDGHGGTLLTLSGVGVVDFIGASHIAAGQITTIT
jgi:hypothetical protein